MRIEDREVEVHGRPVPWRLLVPDGADRGVCVLWGLGWGSTMDASTPGLIGLARRSGLAVATLDVAGHGRNTAVPLGATNAGEQRDEVVAVHDALSSARQAGVVACGTSYGGYLAALLAGRRPVSGLVLQAPANQPDDELDVRADATGYDTDPERYLRRMGTPAVLDRSAATRAVQRIDAPVVVIEHGLDEVVPATVPRGYATAARQSRHVVVRGVPHVPATAAQVAAVEDAVVPGLVEVSRQRRSGRTTEPRFASDR